MRLTDKKTAGMLTAGLVVFVLAFGLIVGSMKQDVPKWADARVTLFKELQAAQTELRNAQLNLISYISNGSDQEYSAFIEAANNFQLHIDTARQDPELNAKLEPVHRFASSVVDQLKLSANTRRDRGKEAAQALITNKETDQIELIDKTLAQCEEYEFGLLTLRLNEYTKTFDSIQWIILAAALIYAVAYFFMARAFQPELVSAKERSNILASELETAKAQLDRIAHVDALTEVLNLRGLEQALAVEENRTERMGGQLIAVLANLDNFRRVNETKGHAIGDVVLKDVAKRITGALRPSDRVARIGGDEFLVLLIDTNLQYATRVAERIRTAISESTYRPKLKLTASIGVAVLPPKIGSIEGVVSLTREALKRSKQAGKNRISIAREGESEEQLAAERNIVEVLCGGEQFRTVFQPIIDLSDESISGYEIFARGPEGAFQSPAEFFRICVENNVLTTVDILCLKLAIASVPNVQTKLRFHLNVFPSTLLDASTDQIIELFKSHPGAQYCIELSEEQFVGDPGYLRDHLSKLKQAGILVAIDDVGFGRSSLESLILLEPDLVKIDRKYVTGVAKEASKQRLLKRVVNVAKSLGSKIVAEGIENEDDVPVLHDIGIHFGQGYYWGGLLDALPADLEANTVAHSKNRSPAN